MHCFGNGLLARPVTTNSNLPHEKFPCRQNSPEMENNIGSKSIFTDLEGDGASPPFIRISSLAAKIAERTEETELEDNSGGSGVSSPVEMARDRSQNLSNSWSEGSWAFRAEDIAEEFPSLEVRHEAMKRVFQSLDHQNDGRTSRLKTSRPPDGDKAVIGGFDKEENTDFYAKLQEAVEKRVANNLTRLTHPNMASIDFLGMPQDTKPKSAPSGEDQAAAKQYYFPELRGLIEDRLEETKVETLTNRLERELTRRQQLCNEQALMLQLLMNRIQELEKRQPKRGPSAPVNGWGRQPRSNAGLYCYTSNYIVEKATQTPSDLHDAEGVYVMVARNSGAKAKKVQKRFAYGYPERVTEEKEVSSILNRKIVTQHIEFLPPIPDPYAKRRPRDAKKPGWHTM